MLDLGAWLSHVRPARSDGPARSARRSGLSEQHTHYLYGAPSAELAITPAGACQVSPMVSGSQALEKLAVGAADSFVIAAPPGTVERRYVMALALRALKVSGLLTIMAPKDKGGSRLGKELASFGLEVEESGRRHQRLCIANRPAEVSGLEAAIAEGQPRIVPSLGLWSQPGLFSWDRLDPGTAQLLAVLPPMSGRGADLGCGTGVIARALLTSVSVEHLDLVDIDRRAVEAAEHNVLDPRVSFHWADARIAPTLEGLDFVVMNPPFHDGGWEDKALGQAFIRRARDALRKGGMLWLVANRHLPYEEVLTPLFAQVKLKSEVKGFKVYEARR